MADTITFDELSEMLANPDVPEETLRKYVTTERALGGTTLQEPTNGMGPVLVPNENVIGAALEGQGTQAKIGMGMLNGLFRERRRKQFERDIVDKPNKPILLAEGDSWFEYPIWLNDTVDFLSSVYSVYCLSAAGDELQAMIADAEYKKYLKRLIDDRGLKVSGILLSGGGNDIVGKTFHGMLRNFKAGATAKDLINQSAFDRKFDDVAGYFRDAIEFITEAYPDIPIFIHGYDHANPLPDQGFKIPPLDGWLGEWLRKRKINDKALQKEIVKRMIDQFCESQEKLAAEFPQVTFVDCRGVVGDQWFDELHPTDEGFHKVAKKFQRALVDQGIA